MSTLYNPILGPFKILGVMALIGILMGFGFSAMRKDTTDQSGRVIEVKDEKSAPISSKVVDVVFDDVSCSVEYNYGGIVKGKNSDDGTIATRCNYDGKDEKTQDELNCLAYACLKK